jgi:hypothetical protein
MRGYTSYVHCGAFQATLIFKCLKRHNFTFGNGSGCSLPGGELQAKKSTAAAVL